MKKLNFKLSLILICFFSSTTFLYAQKEKDEETRYYAFWNKLIPRYAKGQYAGSIGKFSAGLGWNYGKDRWETDLLLGFIPKNADRHAMATLTLKQNYLP